MGSGNPRDARPQAARPQPAERTIWWLPHCGGITMQRISLTCKHQEGREASKQAENAGTL